MPPQNTVRRSKQLLISPPLSASLLPGRDAGKLKNRDKIAPWFLLAYYVILTVGGGWGLTYCLSGGEIHIRFIHLSAGYHATPGDQKAEDLLRPTEMLTGDGAVFCSDSPFWQTDLSREPARADALIDTGFNVSSEITSLACLVSEADVLFPQPRAPVSHSPSDGISITVLLI
jgi:hypothetical protein